MRHEIDSERFSSALNEFITTVEALPPVMEHPGLKAAAAKVCVVLRIARFDVFLRSFSAPNKPPTVNRMVFFSEDEDYDGERCIKIEKPVQNGDDAEYFVYQYMSEPSWTDVERERINVFITTMYVFNGRTRLLGIADRLAYYDRDFGDIHNLPFFMRKMGEFTARGIIGEYCSCRFNLKNFTLVNRQLGRDSGTKVMYAYIKGLGELIGDAGNVCRIGGDNFLAYFRSELLSEVTAYLQGKKIPTDNRETPEIKVSAHAGYYIVREENVIPSDIMDNLIVAMSLAKANPSLPYVMYDEDIKRRQLQRKWVESVFSSAVDNEEFLVYYQPKVNLKTYTIDGAEALCRWRHDGELIPPFRFIPQLEMSNNICILDFYMLEHVCRDIRRWLDEGREVVRISVNLSRVHLGNEMLVERIISIIEKYNVPHKYIEIELTETTTDVDFNELKKLVFRLCAEGIHTSIDDFGTGFSSLSLIYDLPWNIIKIDRSFLPTEDNSGNKQKQIILKHIITMAQNLGIECIVEGVETIEHIALLKDNNCYRAQGFHFDRPLPAKEFEKKLGYASKKS